MRVHAELSKEGKARQGTQKKLYLKCCRKLVSEEINENYGGLMDVSSFTNC